MTLYIKNLKKLSRKELTTLLDREKIKCVELSGMGREWVIVHIKNISKIEKVLENIK
jgi:hypothetical protein